MRSAAPEAGGRAGGPAWFAAGAALLLAGCGGGPSAAGGGCPEPEAAPAAGAWSGTDGEARLVELWRAGGLREGEGLAFPVGLAAGPGHRAAVPDFRLGEVLVVGPDGRWHGSWTRRGEGPGEILRPAAARWTEAGRLVAFDVEGARVVWLDSAGAPARTASLDPDFTGPVVASGSLAWAAVTADGRALLRPGVAPVGGEARGVATLLASRPDSRGADTLARDTVPTLAAEGRFAPVPLPGAPRLAAALGSDGAVLRAAADGGYRVMRLVPESGGTWEPVLCREDDPVPLTDREEGIAGASEAGSELFRAVRAAPEPDRLASFGRFFVGRSGRIWVQRDRPSPGSREGLWGVPGATYDVFHPEGGYLGAVDAPGDARLQAASGDTVWSLEFGELDQASVVAYELRTEEAR